MGEVLNEIDRDGGCRKYSPAEYIKKYLKGYFDVFIADEVHKSKGGATAQGKHSSGVMKSWPVYLWTIRIDLWRSCFGSVLLVIPNEPEADEGTWL